MIGAFFIGLGIGVVLTLTALHLIAMRLERGRR